jgi:hypothetical protein
VEENLSGRSAGRYPYLIYWSIEAGEVWIVHIRHAKREPWDAEES